MANILDAAYAAHDAGLSVIPIKNDGTKAPPFEWADYQSSPANRDQVAAWFDRGRYTGFGVVGGKASGNLEALDFDEADFQLFVETAEGWGIGPLLDRIRGGCEVGTPSGGRHLYYRCDVVAGSQKLAMARGPDPARPRFKPRVLIETRGQGGYVVGPPSNGTVHPDGGAWALVSGGFGTIVTITPEEREDLFALARAFDEMPASEGRQDPFAAFATTAVADSIPPGKDFRAKHGTVETFRTIVEPHGWTIDYIKDGVAYFRRPGKGKGTSASFGFGGTDLFKVFTTSTDFDTEYAHNPASVYAILNHDGDFKAAVKALREKGFGSPAPRPTVGGTSTTVESVVWPDRQELPPAVTVPNMPAEMIPSPLRTWMCDIAEIARLPLEMIAAPAIVGLGSVVGRSVGIRPWNYNDFTVVPNVWGCVVSRPGWMKSFAVEQGLKPIGRLAADAHDAHESGRERAEADVALIEAGMDDLKRRMRAAAKDEKPLELVSLRDKYLSKVKELKAASPVERRYLTHDATIEKLAELLRDNPKGMLVARDELYGLLRSFEKIGRENDRQFYLEGWSGTGSFTSDRIARGTIHVPSLTLSVVGSIQPGRLRSIVDEAAIGGGGDDGLMQRFQVTVWPDRLEPWVKPSRWPDGRARDRVFEIFKTMDEFTWLRLEALSEREGAIPYLIFTPRAQGVADEWHDELEHRLRSDVLDASPAFASHLAKYRSLMPSLALLFHLVDVAAGETAPGPVGEGPALLAAEWCEFLERHAHKIYEVELDRGKAAARSLATKINANAIIDGQTVRDIYRHQWSGLKTDEVVIDGLQVLADLGWVRTQSVATGGRASQVIRLHPTLQGAPS